MSHDSDAIERYEMLYRGIKNLPCVYFEGELISFNRRGLNHILRKGRKLRPVAEQLRRIELIPYCKDILSGKYYDVECRILNKSTINEALFWGFKYKSGNKNIKLIIRQLKTGPKHFFSIFPSKR